MLSVLADVSSVWLTSFQRCCHGSKANAAHPAPIMPTHTDLCCGLSSMCAPTVGVQIYSQNHEAGFCWLNTQCESIM